MKPNISFIIPVYNGEKYLCDSIGSIYGTVNRLSYEILICDDKSTDNSRAVINGISENKNVKAIYHDKNLGAADTRNELISMAESENIFILDCDNILDIETVEKMYELLMYGRDVVSTQRIKFFGFSDPKKPDSEWNFAQWGISVGLQEMLQSFEVPPCSGNYLFKRKVWEDVEGYHTDDVQETWGFGFRHIKCGYKVWLCPNTFYLHRFCRDGFYNRLDKNKMNDSFYSMLNSVREKMTPESQNLMDMEKNGRKLISSGKLRLS